METYILPLTSIVESIQPKIGDVRTVAGKSEVVTIRGQILPVLRLHDLFGIRNAVSDPTRAILVIIEHDDRQAALLVDELIGQNQVVLKSLDDNYHKVPGIAGATILGDGQVAFILDVAGIVHGFNSADHIQQLAA
jgi:two-component system chemotaxis sensor kinase CheA